MSDEREGSARDETTGDPLDLDAWEPQAPPADFAERVLVRVRGEADQAVAGPRRARRWGMFTAGVAALGLAAAIVLRVGATPDARGEAIAKERIEVPAGARARAVLEPGASVRWDGDDVTQPRGDVFYRVEPGARFVVHTPAGDVEVKGTCFAVKVRSGGDEAADERDGATMQKRDMKAGAVGAALSALAFVAVYEGKVAVSHAGERVELGPGESAAAGPDGVRRSGPPGEGERAFEAKVAAAGESAGEGSLAKANENLVSQVGEYRRRLEAIATQKAELEAQLKKTEDKLAAAQDGAAPRARDEFDLDQSDWAELAKQGAVKYRTPCTQPNLWSFTPERLEKLGLAPDDAPALREAFERSHERLWAHIKPLCVQALGASPDIVEKIGPDSCTHLVLDVARGTDASATAEAQLHVAEIRAGLRPAPGPNDKVHPVTRMFLALTGENAAFEADLAKSFGPERAHHLAYADGMCMSTSHFGGKRAKEK